MKLNTWWIVLAMLVLNGVFWTIALGDVAEDREACLDLCEADDEVNPIDCPRLCGAQ